MPYIRNLAPFIFSLHAFPRNTWHYLIGSFNHWSIYNWIAHSATKVKPPEWRIGCTKMAATVVANRQTDMTLFILILYLVLSLKLTLKTNSDPYYTFFIVLPLLPNLQRVLDRE